MVFGFVIAMAAIIGGIVNASKDTGRVLERLDTMHEGISENKEKIEHLTDRVNRHDTRFQRIEDKVGIRSKDD
jgi:hypothetical protein